MGKYWQQGKDWFARRSAAGPPPPQTHQIVPPPPPGQLEPSPSPRHQPPDPPEWGHDPALWDGDDPRFETAWKDLLEFIEEESDTGWSVTRTGPTWFVRSSVRTIVRFRATQHRSGKTWLCCAARTDRTFTVLDPWGDLAHLILGEPEALAAVRSGAVSPGLVLVTEGSGWTLARCLTNEEFAPDRAEQSAYKYLLRHLEQ